MPNAKALLKQDLDLSQNKKSGHMVQQDFIVDQMIDSMTGETRSTPDAEALFDESWTKPIASPGKAPPSNGPDGDGEEEEPPKEERLL